MSVLEAIALGLAAWCVISVIVGLVLGAILGYCDRQEFGDR
jgi:hypothetical protein